MFTRAQICGSAFPGGDQIEARRAKMTRPPTRVRALLRVDTMRRGTHTLSCVCCQIPQVGRLATRGSILSNPNWCSHHTPLEGVVRNAFLLHLDLLAPFPWCAVWLALQMGGRQADQMMRGAGVGPPPGVSGLVISERGHVQFFVETTLFHFFCPQDEDDSLHIDNTSFTNAFVCAD